jgi:undecaprenyl diphosphate synthase
MKQHSTPTPQHIAIIMDGNRRWAKEHKLETVMGHNKGTEIIESVIEHASGKGVAYMTFWAFSTENWKRSKVEVTMLMDIFRKFLNGPVVTRLIAKGVKLQAIGDYTAFPDDIVTDMNRVIEESKDNSVITVNIALNYGGRLEIVQAVQKIVSKNIDPADINAETIAQHLYTNNMPDPDLIIRTGGEQRLSGYLLWQSEYSELYFTDVLWPDFTPKELDKALEEYIRRDRRFGG